MNNFILGALIAATDGVSLQVAILRRKVQPAVTAGKFVVSWHRVSLYDDPAGPQIVIPQLHSLSVAGKVPSPLGTSPSLSLFCTGELRAAAKSFWTSRTHRDTIEVLLFGTKHDLF